MQAAAILLGAPVMSRRRRTRPRWRASLDTSLKISCIPSGGIRAGSLLVREPGRGGARPQRCHDLSARSGGFLHFSLRRCFWPLQCLHARSVAAKWSLTARFFFPDAGARVESDARKNSEVTSPTKYRNLPKSHNPAQSILSPGQGLRTRAKRTTGKQGLRYT